MITELLISAVCAQSMPRYLEACSKATEATLIHLALPQNERRLSDYATELVTKEARRRLGTSTVNTIAIMGATAYKIYKDKQFSYRIPTKKFLPIDYVSPTINKDQVAVGLEWSFK